ncbi:hypothetical protein B0H16DRAFT_1732228 [Mycena metata]|uniref:Uncharacterized protein n=1 Tax=Mycena metata TaxID=1033252 RepID=A0AAD7MVD2_9AGAR|nr:hypothetical protein B0H16DRAFT_1732228 [Mycena metata]
MAHITSRIADSTAFIRSNPIKLLKLPPADSVSTGNKPSTKLIEFLPITFVENVTGQAKAARQSLGFGASHTVADKAAIPEVDIKLWEAPGRVGWVVQKSDVAEVDKGKVKDNFNQVVLDLAKHALTARAFAALTEMIERTKNKANFRLAVFDLGSAERPNDTTNMELSYGLLEENNDINTFNPDKNTKFSAAHHWLTLDDSIFAALRKYISDQLAKHAAEYIAAAKLG